MNTGGRLAHSRCRYQTPTISHFTAVAIAEQGWRSYSQAADDRGRAPELPDMHVVLLINVPCEASANACSISSLPPRRQSLERHVTADNSQFPRLSGLPGDVNRFRSNTFLLFVRKARNYATLATLRGWQFICLFDSVVRRNRYGGERSRPEPSYERCYREGALREA